MRSHELAKGLLNLPDGEVIVEYSLDIRDDEVPPCVVYSFSESVYSGEPAIELRI